MPRFKGKKNRTKLKGKEGYYTYLIAWDVLLCPEQLVAAPVPAKKGPFTFDISPLSTS